MRLEVFTDDAAFDALESEWNPLVARSVMHTPFQLHEFQRAWWSHFGSGKLRVLAARGADGGLVGLASLFVDAQGVLRWVGGEEIADYLDVIAPAAHIREMRQATFGWLAGPAAPDWRRAQLSNIPEWTGTPEHWQSLARVRGWRSEIVELDVCPVVPLPGTFDEYLSQIDSKQRREIRRKRRRVEGGDEAIAWYIVGPDDDLASETDDFLDLMVASHPGKAAFLTPEMKAAFRDIFQRAHASGWLQLSFLTVEGRKAATYACFDVANRIWVYNSGLDPDTAPALSPGWVLLAYLIEHAIGAGRERFDFMQGDEDYKFRFGGVATKVFRLTINRE